MTNYYNIIVYQTVDGGQWTVYGQRSTVHGRKPHGK